MFHSGTYLQWTKHFMSSRIYVPPMYARLDSIIIKTPQGDL